MLLYGYLTKERMTEGDKMAFDYTALRQKIKKEYRTFGAFAAAMGIPYQRMSNMLTGKSDWRVSEVYDAANLLGIVDEIGKYFFTLKSHNIKK